MKKFLPLFALLIMLGGTLAAQGAKTLKSKQISSITVYEHFIEDGEKEPVVESIERYDANGQMVEVKEINRKGDVRKWEKYVYNADGKVVELHFLDAKGRVTEKEKNIYKDGLRIEKQFFNSKDQMYKTKVYKYEYRE